MRSGLMVMEWRNMATDVSIGTIIVKSLFRKNEN